MPNTQYQVSFGWVDAKGNQGRTKYFISSDNGVAHASTVLTSLASLLPPLTNAQLFSLPGIGGELTLSGEYGANLEFPSITDKVVFTFIDSAGSIHRFQMPAPKSGIFLADGITVNKTQTDVAAFGNLIVNGGSNPYFVSTRGGLQYSSFVGGLRVKKANRRSMTIFTKSANLDEPAE